MLYTNGHCSLKPTGFNFIDKLLDGILNVHLHITLFISPVYFFIEEIRQESQIKIVFKDPVLAINPANNLFCLCRLPLNTIDIILKESTGGTQQDRQHLGREMNRSRFESGPFFTLIFRVTLARQACNYGFIPFTFLNSACAFIIFQSAGTTSNFHF